jgi:AbrB family looped-hinge helix DNA binding protein
MPTARITSRGQITIPKAVRDAIGVEAGDCVAFRIQEDGTVIVVLETVEIPSLRGRLVPRGRGISLDAAKKVPNP